MIDDKKIDKIANHIINIFRENYSKFYEPAWGELNNKCFNYLEIELPKLIKEETANMVKDTVVEKGFAGVYDEKDFGDK